MTATEDFINARVRHLNSTLKSQGYECQITTVQSTGQFQAVLKTADGLWIRNLSVFFRPEAFMTWLSTFYSGLALSRDEERRLG